MKRIVAKFILQTLWGWKVETPYPNATAPKSIIMVIHHTSNWDFPIGILLRPILRFESHFVAKNNLFFFPLGNVLTWMGGVAVDRSRHTNFVDACAALFDGKERFQLTVTPEGTRARVTTLKSGFYYIAQKAGVPIVCCKFDWAKKIIGFAEPFYPTGDYEADLKQLLTYFKGVKGRNPERDFEIKD